MLAAVTRATDHTNILKAGAVEDSARYATILRFAWLDGVVPAGADTTDRVQEQFSLISTHLTIDHEIFLDSKLYLGVIRAEENVNVTRMTLGGDPQNPDRTVADVIVNNLARFTGRHPKSHILSTSSDVAEWHPLNTVDGVVSHSMIGQEFLDHLIGLSILVDDDRLFEIVEDYVLGVIRLQAEKRMRSRKAGSRLAPPCQA